MPSGRSSKPLALVKGHRTKKEKAVREKAEKGLVTGFIMHEWPDVKKNDEAHKLFIRLEKAFRAIKHNDILHENTLNRYCMIHAECKEFEKMKEKIYLELNELGEKYSEGEIDFIIFLENKNKLQDKIFQCDKKVMDKRKMLLDIEKENIMTIASALRSIPKKPDESKQKNPMEEFLKNRG